MSLRWTRDAISPIQSCVKPLRGVGRASLVKKHEGDFVIESLGVLFCVEVPMLLAPITPTTGQSVNHLLGAALRASDHVPLAIADGLTALIRLRHAGLTEVFAHHDVSSKLRPIFGDFGVWHLEHYRTIGVSYPA